MRHEPRRAMRPWLALTTAALLATMAAAVTAGNLTWNEQKVAPLGASGYFGNAAAIDGDTAMVAAPQATVGNDAAQGIVYVYHRGADGVWTQATALTGDDAGPDAGFGKAIALHGRYALIGAPGVNAASIPGAVYVFEREAPGLWLQVQKLAVDAGVNGDRFGDSVAFDSAYNFDTGALQAWALIGADGVDGNSGVAYVWHADYSDATTMGNWQPGQTLDASDVSANALFGASVALALAPSIGSSVPVGGRAMVGAPANESALDSTGRVYAFDFNHASSGDDLVLVQTQALQLHDDVDNPQPLNFGYAVALSDDGHLAAISAPSWNAYRASRVAVLALDAASDQWSQTDVLASVTAQPKDFFGRSLNFGHGWLLVGAPWVDHGAFDAGASFLFGVEQGAWVLRKQLVASDGGYGDSFGAGAAIAADGTVLLGAPLAEAAYFYTPPDEIFSNGFDGEGGS